MAKTTVVYPGRPTKRVSTRQQRADMKLRRELARLDSIAGTRATRCGGVIRRRKAIDVQKIDESSEGHTSDSVWPALKGPC